METQFFHKMKYDLKVHTRSHVALLCSEIYVFLYISFVSNSNVNNMLILCRHQLIHEMKLDLIGQGRSHIIYM